jgi:hypothetical protein
MLLGAAKTLVSILTVTLIGCGVARAMCSVDVVMVRGRVENAPSDAKVRVQLVYPKDVAGESGSVTVEDGRFSIPIDFLTQSRRPVINGILEKCGRRPKTVIVTLVGSDEGREYDRVSLDFAKDFRMSDPTAYALRAELVLNGARGESEFATRLKPRPFNPLFCASSFR